MPVGLRLGFPRGSVVTNSPAVQETLSLIPGLERCPGGENGNSVFMPGESHGQKSLVGCSPLGCKDLDMT